MTRWLALTAGGRVLPVVFIFIERVFRHPLLPLSALANRTRGGAYVNWLPHIDVEARSDLELATNDHAKSETLSGATPGTHRVD